MDNVMDEDTASSTPLVFAIRDHLIAVEPGILVTDSDILRLKILEKRR